MRSAKINCTQLLLKFHEYYVPVLELSLSTTNRCTQTQLIIKIPCTQLKYLSTHCNRGRSCCPTLGLKLCWSSPPLPFSVKIHQVMLVLSSSYLFRWKNCGNLRSTPITLVSQHVISIPLGFHYRLSFITPTPSDFLPPKTSIYPL